MIPIAKPSVGDEEANAAAAVIKSGMLASGDEVLKFETEFAEYINVPYAIATTNGTTALHLALLAVGIGPGDEVIVPSFTFIATASSVSMCGAKPVLADIEKDTYTINPDSINEAISEKTKAIIGVHLFGQSCDIKSIAEICEDKNLFFIEDCAQAHGTEYNGKKVGSFGDAGCFSFYPTKNMTCGEGGMITCKESNVSEKIRRLLNHGQKEKYLHTEIGYNYRLTNISAAIGRVQLRKLPDMNQKRINNGHYYNGHIYRSDVITPITRVESNHVYHQYAIRIQKTKEMDREKMIEYLSENGIGTAIHYPIPIHEQPVFKNNIKGSKCPVSALIAQEIMSIPVYPDLSIEDRQKIAQTINEAV